MPTTPDPRSRLPGGERGLVQVAGGQPGQAGDLGGGILQPDAGADELLHLRQRQLTERANGVEHVSVGAEELLEQIALYRPQDAGDKAGDRNRAQKAIESAVRLGALARTTDPDRYLITAVIESVLPAQKLPALLAWFREENRPGAHEHDDVPESAAPTEEDAE